MPQLARRQSGVLREWPDPDLPFGGLSVQQRAHALHRRMVGRVRVHVVRRRDHVEQRFSEHERHLGCHALVEAHVRRKRDRGSARRVIPS